MYNSLFWLRLTCGTYKKYIWQVVPLELLYDKSFFLKHVWHVVETISNTSFYKSYDTSFQELYDISFVNNSVWFFFLITRDMSFILHMYDISLLLIFCMTNHFLIKILYNKLAFILWNVSYDTSFSISIVWQVVVFNHYYMKYHFTFVKVWQVFWQYCMTNHS